MGKFPTAHVHFTIDHQSMPAAEIARSRGRAREGETHKAAGARAGNASRERFSRAKLLRTHARASKQWTIHCF